MSATPRDPTNEHDERDERLAALLETEPLDEITRARLVRTAMAAIDSGDAAHGAGSRLRWLSAAAAIVVVLAVGLAVFVRNDSGSQNASTQSAKALRPNDEIEVLPWESVGTGPDRIASSLPQLGDLGDVGSRAMLRQAVTAALPAHAQAFEERGQTVSPSAAADAAVSALPSVVEVDCPAGARPPSGTTIAVGTGTVHGKSVSVWVVEQADGDRVAFAVDGGCVVGKPVPI